MINRVLKAPVPNASIAEGSVSLGSGGERRLTGDVGRSLGQSFSFRTAAAAENSTSFRDDYLLKRVTVAPSLLWSGRATTALAQVEFLDDRRIPDRGLPSVNGRPADVRLGQTYGYPSDDYVDTTVVSGTIRLERRFAGGWLLREVVRLGTVRHVVQQHRAIGSTLVGDSWRVSRQQYNANQSQQNLFSQPKACSQPALAERSTSCSRRGGAWRPAAGHDAVQRHGRRRFRSIDPVLSQAGLFDRSQPPTTVFTGTTAAVYAQDQLCSEPCGRRSPGCAAIAMRSNSTTVGAQNVDLVANRRELESSRGRRVPAHAAHLRCTPP